MAKTPMSAPHTPGVVVPRGWLVLITGLLVVPWLLGGWWLAAGRSRNAAAENAVTVVAGARPAQPGPWGQLTLSPVVISPPMEYVPADWGRNSPAQWAFPGMPPEQVDGLLVNAGLSPEQRRQLQPTTRVVPQISGTAISPPPVFVRSLSPDVRARLYGQLASSSLNADQAHAFRFLGATAGDWFNGSLIAPATRAVVEPLVYHDGPFLYFADAESIRDVVKDPGELQRLAKALLRNSTYLVHLSVGQAEEVGALADYWGRGGRRTDIRPLLESVTGGGANRSIDIVHLLPQFARNHLYRYPKVTTEDMQRPLLANCLWSSLNFFNTVPDDRYLDVETGLASLRRDYYVVESDYQLGDVVALLDQEGVLFHVAVYIADGLVFTKNGASPVAPWVLMRLDDLTAFYRRQADPPRLIFHRLNVY